MNKVILMGRLTADPEYRQTTGGTPCCRFRIAVDRPKAKDAQESKTDFFNIVAWKSRAEFVSRYFRKGSRILIEGAMRNNDYTDNSGVKHYGIEVLAERIEFCDSKQTSTGAQAAPPPQYNQNPQQYQAPQQYQQQYPQYDPAPPPQFGTVPPPNYNPYHP